MSTDLIDKKVFPGARFGKLTVVSEGEPIPRNDGKSPRRTMLCLCDCGKEVLVLRDSLVSGNTKSCGCLNFEKGRPPRRKSHGMANTRIYRIWSHMKERCNNPNNNRYYRYGARGIKLCSEWECSFETFYKWAIDNGYKDDLSIERKDNDLGYCPENCCWIPLKDQAKNKGSKSK